jgi:hypothetical protein
MLHLAQLNNVASFAPDQFLGQELDARFRSALHDKPSYRCANDGYQTPQRYRGRSFLEKSTSNRTEKEYERDHNDRVNPSHLA